MAAELARLQAAIEASGDVLYDWDLATDELNWSGASSGLFGGLSAHMPVTGEVLNGRINPEDLPQRLLSLKEHFAGMRGYDCEYRIRGEGGQFHWVHDRGAVEVSSTGTPARMLGVMRLVTHRKQHEAKLEYLASFDDLTGHYNKLRLRESLEQALAQGIRLARDGAFLVIGVDQLGRINSAYGHEAGDRVLFEVAHRLGQTLRGSDVVGRLDSDRFGVVLAGYNAEQAFRTAERVLQAIRHEPVEIGERRIYATASVSIVLFPAHSQTAFDAITKAEGALLKAKQAGRDCITLYEMSEEQRRDQVTSMAVVEEVRAALREDRLTLAYQPVVDAASEEVRFYECLLRMRRPGGALVSADRFVPVVERLGLMSTIDRRVLDLAVHDLTAHPEVSLAVNISGLTAIDHAWLRTLKGHMKERPDLSRRLIVEITETAALHDIEESAKFVTAVRDLGCKVAVDDFGAGYTTFRHLKCLTVDVVKIDGSFVHGIHASQENQLFVRNLLALARSFGLVAVAEAVAECVEEAEDVAYLRGEGVDLLQGYYFGKPQIVPVWKADGKGKGRGRRRAHEVAH
jgi:diguanylate cyclase (GGDEF)-like protein